ncbi:MAG: hypothetical protein ACRDNZ_13225 [Streptosporangiaceae bacterium]
MRRVVLAGAACLVLAGCLAMAGCGRVDGALSRQRATVTFRPDATAAVIAQVRSACSGLPNVRLEPAPAGSGSDDSGSDAGGSGAGGSGVPSSLRYDVSQASGTDLARLQACLMRFPLAVLGVSLKDVANEG